MKIRFYTVILLLIISVQTISSQSINKPKLDSLMNILEQKNKGMGSLAISKNGSILYRRAIGYSFISESKNSIANESTKYRIGSITKMFTATMIFQLIEEGKLSMATTLGKFFPQLPNSKLITISHLLNHRSGLHNFTDGPEYLQWMTQPKTENEMLAIISKNKVDFQPNTKASYSNSNYVVLGYIVEKISKKSYAQNLKERISTKIGLANTYIGGKTNTSNNESFSYRFINGWKQEPETDMSIPGGAGAILSTPSDLTTIIEGLFMGKLISKSSLAMMKTITDGYGMGMFQVPFYNKTGLGHSGGIDGFAANLFYFAEDSLSVAYCTNGQVYPINDILIGVLSVCFNKDYPLPTFNEVTLTTEELDKYLGVYSSEQIPLKITITKNNNILIAQATGQPSFPLEATDTDHFKFDQAGVKLEFTPAKNEMILKQGGGNYIFMRDK